MPSRFEYERAVRSSDLPSLSRLLALTVATWADVKTGVIPDRLQPSLTTLEEATGMARGSVRKHLDTLEAGGWLKRDRPSVAAARSAKARTKYTIKVPRGAAVSDTDGIELGQDVSSTRAGDALDAPELGQELPQARAGDALALGQEMTTTRAGAALSSSYGPKTSVEYQLHRPPAVATPAPEDTDAFRVAQPLIDEMTSRGMRLSWQMQAGDWKDLIGLIHAHGAPALAEHAERVWRSSKNPPYSARYFLAGWRGLAALPPGAAPPLKAVSGGYQPYRQPTPEDRAADLGHF